MASPLDSCAERPPTAALIEPAAGVLSSSTIVPVAVASASTAAVGLDNVSLNVSFAPCVVSGRSGSLMTPVVCPAGKANRPDVAVKSLPEDAVPLLVA